MGRLTTVFDSRSQTYQFSYGANGRLTTVTGPDGRRVTFTHYTGTETNGSGTIL